MVALAPTACKHRVSGTLSLPSRGSFHLSLTVLFAIGHQVVFSLGGWSPRLPTGFLVSCGTLDSEPLASFSLTGLVPSPVLLSFSVLLRSFRFLSVRNPFGPKTKGLGSFPFARRYSENRVYFLFLRLLRCFSSPGSPRYTIDSCNVTYAFPYVSSLIRKSAVYRLLATTRSLSQPATSFFGAWCQGILPMLFVA